jgi:hypothetical protein
VKLSQREFLLESYYFSIITPRRSIASRRFIRNIINNFEKVKNFGLTEYKA